MPELKYSVDDHGDVAVVHVQGDMDVYTAPSFRTGLLELMGADPEGRIDPAREGFLRVVIDTSGITFIDSSGLGILVGALRRARIGGGGLALVVNTEKIEMVMRVTGLPNVFDVFPTEDEAVEHLRAQAKGKRTGEDGDFPTSAPTAP